MATYHVSAPVIFNANLKNETDAPIKCDISTTFKNQLLSNKSKFNVAVSKLRIPTTELVLMDIPNSAVVMIPFLSTSASPEQQAESRTFRVTTFTATTRN